MPPEQAATKLADHPTIGAIRAQRGLPPPKPTPGLAEAVGLANAAWRDWTNAAAHLTLAARPTTDRHFAPVWARNQLARWTEELDLHEINERADELVAEAADHARGWTA